ncbi:hypothetical protein DKG77_03170 [Flagellimonas aquimarina]|uniref:Glycosyltransferase n=1 Tax=Flagellimonas aquimarina TaxID=2201895 RepID=A0A316L168_9FLAO|nr:glycosyltransferase family 4 protein [Allomuricauda koreensis]PWL39844.1 hypothetical protein DKG77_03170 [Allomuricauda koreensis]
MRVLIFNTLYTPYKIGGAEISVQDLAENLLDNGIKVGVVTLGENKEKTMVNGIVVWRLKLQNVFWPFNEEPSSTLTKLKWHWEDVYNKRYQEDVNKIFLEFKPHIVHTNNLAGFSVAIWDIAHGRNIKVVHTLRDYYLQCPRTTRFKGRNLCTKQCLECNLLSIKKKKASQKVHGLIGISKYILNDHISKGYFLSSKKQVIYNGFMIPRRKTGNTQFEEKDKVNFGFIGQINQSKGLELLVESFSALKSNRNWVLHVAGKINDNYKKELSSKLLKGKVVFHGFVKPKDFFPQIDVLVVPSIWEEPFGRVILEGLINEKPILGSNRGGIPELLGAENKSFMFQPNREELTQILKKVIVSPKTLNEFSFDKIDLKQFSIETSVGKYIDLFTRALNG